MEGENQNQVTEERNEGGRSGGGSMKTVVSWVIVLIVIAGGVFLLLSNDTEDTDVGGAQNAEDADGEAVGSEAEVMGMPAPGHEGVDEMIVVGDGKNVVTYTDGGFSPKEITIKKGESVTFMNESDGEMWTASAQHPTHKNYPTKSDNDCFGSSFDQCESTESGTEWTFIFDAEGEHTYHNHMKSNHFGKIIVE